MARHRVATHHLGKQLYSEFFSFGTIEKERRTQSTGARNSWLNALHFFSIQNWLRSGQILRTWCPFQDSRIWMFQLWFSYLFVVRQWVATYHLGNCLERTMFFGLVLCFFWHTEFRESALSCFESADIFWTCIAVYFKTAESAGGIFDILRSVFRVLCSGCKPVNIPNSFLVRSSSFFRNLVLSLKVCLAYLRRWILVQRTVFLISFQSVDLSWK